MGSALTSDIGPLDLAALSGLDAAVASIKSNIEELKKIVRTMSVAPRQRLGVRLARVKAKMKKEATPKVRLIVFAGPSAQRRNNHTVEVVTGPSATWRTRCSWCFGRGSKVELIEPVDLATVKATDFRAVCAPVAASRSWRSRQCS